MASHRKCGNGRKSGRRVGLARLTRRCRARVWIPPNGPTDEEYPADEATKERVHERTFLPLAPVTAVWNISTCKSAQARIAQKPMLFAFGMRTGLLVKAAR
jgi:hypothetical protein